MSAILADLAGPSMRRISVSVATDLERRASGLINSAFACRGGKSREPRSWRPEHAGSFRTPRDGRGDRLPAAAGSRTAGLRKQRMNRMDDTK